MKPAKRPPQKRVYQPNPEQRRRAIERRAQAFVEKKNKLANPTPDMLAARERSKKDVRFRLEQLFEHTPDPNVNRLMQIPFAWEMVRQVLTEMGRTDLIAKRDAYVKHASDMAVAHNKKKKNPKQ